MSKTVERGPRYAARHARMQKRPATPPPYARRSLSRSASQRGVVLLVSLILLLLVTFVGFSTMETSNLEMKMSTSREIREQTFQSAETSIELALDDMSLISQAYSVSLQGSDQWPSRTYTFEDPQLSGGVNVEFLSTANSMGYSVRKGASGIATYFYDVEGTARRANTNISSEHRQSVYVEGPSLN